MAGSAVHWSDTHVVFVKERKYIPADQCMLSADVSSEEKVTKWEADLDDKQQQLKSREATMKQVAKEVQELKQQRSKLDASGCEVAAARQQALQAAQQAFKAAQQAFHKEDKQQQPQDSLDQQEQLQAAKDALIAVVKEQELQESQEAEVRKRARDMSLHLLEQSRAYHRLKQSAVCPPVKWADFDFQQMSSKGQLQVYLARKSSLLTAILICGCILCTNARFHSRQ